ncbi:MAG: hypothetical protein HYX47_13885 [Burkholderiales bacterium]|nr:hypothetical protein [Burkholderiales bacterium]
MKHTFKAAVAAALLAASSIAAAIGVGNNTLSPTCHGASRPIPSCCPAVPICGWT